jgi:hypothetical protein
MKINNVSTVNVNISSVLKRKGAHLIRKNDV